MRVERRGLATGSRDRRRSDGDTLSAQRHYPPIALGFDRCSHRAALRPGGGTTQRYLDRRSPLGDQKFGGHRRSGKARHGIGDSVGHEHRAAGIIDPALVARTALQNAASVAGLMLTTNVIVTELKDDTEPAEEAVS